MGEKNIRKFGCTNCGHSFDENDVDEIFLNDFGFPKCPNCETEDSSYVFEA